MANNLVVQLLLKTGSFSNDLKHAGGQVNQFKQNCSNAGKALTQFGSAMGINIGSLTKLGGAAGAAVVAFKTFKGVMYSTQTTADALDGAIAGCKGVIDALNVSVATADFSTFSNGLWAVFDAAKAARDALDDLQDANLAYNYKTSKNRRLARENEVGYKTPGATPAEKEEYRKAWEQNVIDQEQYAEAFDYKILRAIKERVVAKNTNILAKNVTKGILERAMNIQLGLEGDTTDVKEAIKERVKKINEDAKKYATDSKREQYYSDSKRQEDLILNILLQMKDDTIRAVVEEARAGEQAKEEAASMRKAYNRAIKGTPTGNGGGTGGTVTEKDVELLKDSRAFWSQIASEARKAAENTVAYSDAWKEAVDKEDEALAKIKEIDLHLAAYRSRKNFVPLERLPEIKGGFQLGTQPIEVPEIVEEKSIDRVSALSSSLHMLTSGLSTLSDAFYKITGQEEDVESGFKRFIEVIQTGVNVFQGFASIMQTITSLQDIYTASAEKTSAAETGRAAATMSAAQTVIAAKKAEAIANGDAAAAAAADAAAEAAKSVAGTPIIGPALAIAAAGSVIAAIIAAMSKAQTQQKFATGGIVGGNSFTGDRVSAQVNSGEMILTKAQQARLFQIANGSSQGGNQVTFHISGQDLVGVLNNQTRKNNIIR